MQAPLRDRVVAAVLGAGTVVFNALSTFDLF
jgi:hypothetical protein